MRFVSKKKSEEKKIRTKNHIKYEMITVFEAKTEIE